MNQTLSILSITASDSTGSSGMQADVRTICEMGGIPFSVITSVSTMGFLGKKYIHDLPQDIVDSQLGLLLNSGRPRAVKVGVVPGIGLISAVSEFLGSRCEGIPVVLSPGIMMSDGYRLLHDEDVDSVHRLLIPRATLLVLQCGEAQVLLNRPVATDEDMLSAARSLCRSGARWVMLRGGVRPDGRCIALLYGPGTCRYFASYNIEGWRQHGVTGTLTAAIAVRLGMGDDVPAAVTKAHDYVHARVVYAVSPDARHLRPSALYNQFLSLVAQHYRTSHDVAFYADKLSVSTRYLSQLTNRYVGKSPKVVIAEYVVQEARVLLDTTTLSIQQISFRLGFPDQAAFSKFVKIYSGQTPSQMRSR
ncbi:MAG: hydroxymethylpyrimidine/phosphomethylpyrimidine kinase [Bacteroidales bacterium]|nr:hydroxymethylpyrimidine/phosphomethylpyrimidine kinase [Bacteroidales bacterium]